MPLIRRLRRGKFAASGGVPSANSRDSVPLAASSCASDLLRAGYTNVEAGADQRHAAPGAGEPAAMGRGVYAQREPADDRDARRAQRARELGCILAALC